MSRDTSPLAVTASHPAATPAFGSAWRREVFLRVTFSRRSLTTGSFSNTPVDRSFFRARLSAASAIGEQVCSPRWNGNHLSIRASLGHCIIRSCGGASLTRRDSTRWGWDQEEHGCSPPTSARLQLVCRSSARVDDWISSPPRRSFPVVTCSGRTPSRPSTCAGRWQPRAWRRSAWPGWASCRLPSDAGSARTTDPKEAE